MGQVNVTINGRAYGVVCDDGEEQHLGELAQYLDQHVAALASSVGQVGDARLILMASLLVADELSDAQQQVKLLEQEIQTLKDARSFAADRAQETEAAVAGILEQAAQRLDSLAGRIETA